jgi:type II secretory pathway component GspD/PulD (secretin)
VKVAKILDEMDVKAPQVALSTVIGELTLSNDEQFGVDYFQRFTRFNPPDGNGGGAGLANNSRQTGIIDPANLLNFTQLANAAAATATGGATTNIFLNTGNSLTAIVRALDETKRFRVVSRPMVFTSNNKKAIIASGTEIPIPVNTYSAPTTVVDVNNPQNAFANSSSIQFKKVALQLEVVPLINSEREVTLDILQKVDSVSTRTNVNGNLIPNIATRYIKTTVSAPNCSTIVLGGLIMDDKSRNVNGIPLLSRIPLIGGLFRSTEKSKNRSELLVLMRPEVALTKLDLHRLREKNSDKTHFGPELDQDDCPDCPKSVQPEDKQIVLPGPDLPGMK